MITGDIMINKMKYSTQAQHQLSPPYGKSQISAKTWIDSYPGMLPSANYPRG